MRKGAFVAAEACVLVWIALHELDSVHIFHGWLCDSWYNTVCSGKGSCKIIDLIKAYFESNK